MVKCILCLIFIASVSFSIGQQPQKIFTPDSFTSDHITELKKEVGQYKHYPQQYEKQILIALSYYPELKNTPIYFRIRAKHTPLTTRSSWSGLLKPQAKRDYVITISDTTEEMLMRLLFRHLPFNAQVGVIGHELGHVVDFSTMSTLEITKHAARNISSKYIDHFEFRTDSICIAHGLGYQLLSWSSYVRQTMRKDNWDGADNIHKPMMRERYMNPSTIKDRISQSPLYHHSAEGSDQRQLL